MGLSIVLFYIVSSSGIDADVRVNTCDSLVIRGGSLAVLAAVNEFVNSNVTRHIQDADKVFAKLIRIMLMEAASAGQSVDGIANAHVVTVQIGANDGRQNDPFYTHVIKSNVITHNALKSWVPIMFEPASSMYEKLNIHWQNMAHKSACYVTARRPIKYHGEKTCPFYYFNASVVDGNNSICKKCTPCEKHPKWMREQIGSLDEVSTRAFFYPNFERCIAIEQLECGPIRPILDTLTWVPGTTNKIDLIHIDTEGYDGHIIHGILDKIDILPPAAIYFEAKVMRDHIWSAPYKQDRFSCFFMDLFDRLDALGWMVVYNGGEDALAIHNNRKPTRLWTKKHPMRCRDSIQSDVDRNKTWNALANCCKTK